MLRDEILDIKNKAREEISAASSAEVIFNLEKKYLGRKSQFVSILKNLKNLTSEERRELGQLANKTKSEISAFVNNKKKELISSNFDFEKERIDVTIPGIRAGIGHLNPISLVRNEIEDIFSRMGYGIPEGPEVETEYYNFDALNIPKDHPARDMQDTFWVKTDIGKERLIMRPQTSAMQVKYMEKQKPPFRIIIPGKCFRSEATDSTHEHTFYQFEALTVGDDINVGHLKFAAQEFFSQFFKQEVRIRLRPSYFPFTEPGFEFDITCTMCQGNLPAGRQKACSACKSAGWLELGGAGMVDQNVFVAAGYPRNRYQGFAWAFGLERLAMMKYKIDDVRLFHSGDLRFVRQF